MCEALRRYDLAVPLYRDLLARYPSTREAERALFRVAHVYLAAGMPDDAHRVWDEFTGLYPGSEWNAYADAEFTRAG